MTPASVDDDDNAVRDATAVWLTTLGADGAPHTVPVWFVLVDSRVWVATSTPSQKAANLGRDARVSLAIDGSSPSPHVALGTAAVLDRPEDHPDVLRAFSAKYHGWDAADPSRYGPRVLIEVTVDRWLLGGP